MALFERLYVRSDKKLVWKKKQQFNLKIDISGRETFLVERLDLGTGNTGLADTSSNNCINRDQIAPDDYKLGHQVLDKHRSSIQIGRAVADCMTPFCYVSFEPLQLVLRVEERILTRRRMGR